MSLLTSLTPLTLSSTAQQEPVHDLSQATPQRAKTHIKSISKDVFGNILSFLPALEQITCVPRVCKDWSNLPLVNNGRLDLSELTNLRDLKTILDQASGIRITSINLTNCKNITDADLAHLSSLTSLTSLNLSGCKNITDAGLAHLLSLTSLISLDLSDCNITDANLALLSKLTLLSSLDLSGCQNITDAGLAHLSSLTLLSSLDLSVCHNITDAGLARLSSLTLLSSLDLSGCRNIIGTGLAHLSKLTSLTSLDLGVCRNITDAGLAHLSKFTSLSSLNLRWCRSITDAGLAHLSSLTSLSSLSLSGCKNITDVGLVHLSSLTSLTSLDLSECKKITDAGLAHSSSLTSLTSLNLTGSQNITDAGLVHLSKLTSLTSLKLHSGISSDAVKALKAKLIPIEFKDAPFRDRMDYYIYMLASQPKGGDEWGKKNRYHDLDRLRLAQALAILNMSRPSLFKELSVDPLLDLINQSNATNQHIDHLLNELPEETRNAIFDQVYQLAPHPKGGEKWGESHRFDDPARFRLAVIEVIKNQAQQVL